MPKKYVVSIYFTGRAEYEVEAENAQEAIQKAQQLNDAESDVAILEHMSGGLEFSYALIERVT